ncbi:MAG TPA: HEAT repeat domain-containing protein [Thermoanaerobaculia bacterium]|nr:HEAT repeat domain-containing protein [Thermoanaerobaculia bacterium]
MSRQYLVLGKGTGTAQVFEEIQPALEALLDKDLVFKPPYHEELSDGLVEELWLERDKKALLTLVSDFETPAQYLIIEAEKQEILTQIASILEKHVSFIPVSELREEAGQKMKDAYGALIRLIWGSSETFDKTSAAILLQGLKAEEEHVRYEAVMAAGLSHWAELVDELRPISQNDEDEEIAETARRAMKACRQGPRRRDTTYLYLKGTA